MTCYMTKAPDEARDYALAWDGLDADERLAEDLGWTIVPQDLDPMGLSLVSAKIDEDRSVAVLRGGRPGHVYHVACRVRTSAGRILTRGFLLRVNEA